MTIHALGYIQFKTHSVYISKDNNDRIYCFKATDSRCDLDSFVDEELAADYIMRPFEVLVYTVQLSDDEDYPDSF